MLAFPILTRAYRTQWRDRRLFVFLLLLSGAFTGFLLWRYADEAVSYSETRDVQERLRAVGQSLWWQIAWAQTAVALLVAPALTAGSIARERERGLLDGLQLAALSPFRIVVEKWVSALAPLLLILVVLLPFDLIAVLLSGFGLPSLAGVWGFQILLVATGAAIGLACSAWARRAHLALRSAYALVIMWLIASGGAALVAGDTFFGVVIPGYSPPIYMSWIGHTSPIFGASDLIMPALRAATSSGDRWPAAVASLIFITLFCAWTSVRALQKPLAQAPFIESKRSKKAGKKRATAGQIGHFEVPVVGGLRFANPVMGREVRSKFRLRQPPLGVILVEGVLALAVAYFYARTLYSAFTDASAREIIFWGVTFTGLFVTLISCGIMGANGFSREHEGGTWESLRLSRLDAREIIGGKFRGIALVCALFSLPVWPLLLPCISWGTPLSTPFNDALAVSQLVAVVLVWASSGLAATLWGLWLGLRSRRTSSASGMTLGGGVVWLVGVPLVLLVSNNSERAEWWLAALNPFAALLATQNWRSSDFGQWALPFTLVSLLFCVLSWLALWRRVQRDLMNGEAH